MTIRDKIEALKKVQGYREEISELLEKIIVNTYNYHCNGIRNFNIDTSRIFVDYEWTCRGEDDVDELSIPIEWLDEGFDYKAAYDEELRRAELARKREEEKEKKRREEERRRREELKKTREYQKYLELKKTREYQKYLELKKKYES